MLPNHDRQDHHDCGTGHVEHDHQSSAVIPLGDHAPERAKQGVGQKPGNGRRGERGLLEQAAAGEFAQQIARLAAAGLSNREIGERLFVSHRTVASHLYRIFPKLGVGSRVQIARAMPEHERAGAPL